MKAIQYDEERGAYPDPHLEHALHMIGENGDKGEIRKEIESYIALYQRQHAGSLPNNMAILYDYLTLVGETNWYAAPASVISTKNMEPIRTSSGGSNAGLTGPEVIAAAIGSSVTSAPPPTPVAQPVPKAQPVSKAHPTPKKVSGQ